MQKEILKKKNADQESYDNIKIMIQVIEKRLKELDWKTLRFIMTI